MKMNAATNCHMAMPITSCRNQLGETSDKSMGRSDVPATADWSCAFGSCAKAQ
ncbi:MAG: hypothetical protein HQ592_04425 [Planctomycetes bacterium]|nr:hypothetical protein [Planctomycetota bacterium]